MEDDFIKTAIELITPVMEGAVITAAHYAKACGRNTVTSEDMKYGMRYCAQTVVGKHLGTMFPELQYSDSDEDEEDDMSDIEEVDDGDEPFTRYSGDDELMNSVNKCHDDWDQWEPFSPIEKLIKSSVDKSG
jgi:histone H3/H4